MLTVLGNQILFHLVWEACIVSYLSYRHLHTLSHCKHIASNVPLESGERLANVQMWARVGINLECVPFRTLKNMYKNKIEMSGAGCHTNRIF